MFVVLECSRGPLPCALFLLSAVYTIARFNCFVSNQFAVTNVSGASAQDRELGNFLEAVA